MKDEIRKVLAYGTVYMADSEKKELIRWINEVYLDDPEANKLVNGRYVSKYPEKETQEYLNAIYIINSGRWNLDVIVEIDTKGKPRFAIKNNGI